MYIGGAFVHAPTMPPNERTDKKAVTARINEDGIVRNGKCV
jgi:hypothetical protein